MGRAFSAIVFDLDGTVVDSGPAICGGASDAFARLGVSVRPDEIRPHLGAPLEELFAHFAPAQGAAASARFVQYYIEAHDAHPELVPRVYDGAEEALRHFRTTSALGIATTKPTERAKDTLRHVSLLSHFDHVQGTDPPMRPKPSPDVLAAALAALEAPAESAVFVGDTARDVHAARALGVFSVLVEHEGGGPVDAPADFRCEGFGGLLAFLARAGPVPTER